MPMPREEDDDLFPSAADVEFDDEVKPKKGAKKKTAKKKAAASSDAAEKPAVKKKAATKKAAKKKPVADYDDTAGRVKPARTKRVAKAAAPKPVKKAGGFGAGLFDDETPSPVEEPMAAEAVVNAPAAPAPSEGREPAYGREQDRDSLEREAPVDEYGRPEPQANYVVHVYELGRFKRTIDRAFTPEAAEAFATEFCRTSKRYGRKAVAGKKDTQPAKELV